MGDARPQFRTDPVAVRVPATSANLGPGFDTFGLALALHDEVVAMVTDDEGVVVEVEGEGAADLPRDHKHLVARAMLAGFDAMGGEPAGLLLRCKNSIPHGRGLGSSAAAVVAGLVAARGLVEDGLERLPDEDLLGIASDMEGHPDNAAAALVGGFTIAWTEEVVRDGGEASEVRVVRLDPHPDVTAVVAVPPGTLSTSTARALLSADVPRADAVFNLGRAALLVPALTARPDLLMVATEDRLHQDARRPAYPETGDLVAALRATGIPAVVSGAGPSVLALGVGIDPADVAALAPAGWRVHAVPTDPAGCREVTLGR